MPFSDTFFHIRILFVTVCLCILQLTGSCVNLSLFFRNICFFLCNSIFCTCNVCFGSIDLNHQIYHICIHSIDF